MSGAVAHTASSLTTPPPDAVLPPRGSHAPAPGEPVPSHFRWCFGCGAEHPTGLHVSVVAGEGLTVTGRMVVTDNHQGAPGLAHGGVLTAVLDEVLGSLNWLLGLPAVTARLEVDFRRPVPVGSPLALDARITGVHGRKVFMEAQGTLVDGTLAVSAAAMFLSVPLQHFLTHGNPEQVHQALADRASGGPAWRGAGKDDVEINP